MSNPSIWQEAWGSLKNAIIGSSVAVVFGIAVLLLSLLSVANPMLVKPAEAPVATDAGILAPKVEYYLPYPGILPDSPLYRFKAVRDRLQVWLTPGGEAKAKLLLLLADKRLNAAIFLIGGNKADFGVSTATKAEKYLAQAVDQVVAQQQQGKDVKSLLLTLSQATAKHAEILAGLAEQVSGDQRAVLRQSVDMARLQMQRVSQSFLDSK